MTHADQRADEPAITPHRSEFSGSGGEYFRVWIVNVLLTIVTLGFYTPFARRRTVQYFYGHTLVAGSPLEFTAQQKRMVIGFVIFVVLYGSFQLAAETGQDAVLAILMLGGAVLAPYFWASAMRFRLNATRWRGVRLQFTASWGEVYRASWPVFAIAGLWIVFSFAVGALVPEMPDDAPPQLRDIPWLPLLAIGGVAAAGSFLCLVKLEFNYKSLLVARARIGGQAGRWKPVFGDFLRIWLATLGVFLLSVLVVATLVGLAFGGSIALIAGKKAAGFLFFLMMLGMFVGAIFALFLASAPARAYREARMFRLVWNNVGVSHLARFKCRLKVRRYVMLRVKNIFLTLFTLGFYRPFALVAEYRMKTESVTLHVKGGLDQLAGQLAREEQGLGDAIADAMGLDMVG
jgi:uncharacterized membrane protein YjgN (DUF898 family)